MKCPKCLATTKQYKAGFNPSGSQRYRCGACRRVYTPEPKSRGYPSERRMLALQLYMEGNSQRAIARILKIGQQTVANWVEAYIDKLPTVLEPEQPLEAELAELYSFLQQNDTKFISRLLD